MHRIIVVILAFHDLPTNEQVLQQISPKEWHKLNEPDC